MHPTPRNPVSHPVSHAQQTPSRADVSSACLRWITRSLQLLQVLWHEMGASVLPAVEVDDGGGPHQHQQLQSILPQLTCQATSVMTQLLLTSDDPLVLSSGLGAYAAACDATLRICSGSSDDPAVMDLLSWMKGDGSSCIIMKVMLRCFYFPAVHTVCVAAIKAMKLVCSSLLNHYNGSSTSSFITDILFPMLHLVLDTSQRGGAGGSADVTLECDPMKRFSSCMAARLQCASTFPWLLAFARLDAGDSLKRLNPSSASAVARAAKLHHFMMRALLLSESAIFSPETKTRSVFFAFLNFVLFSSTIN